MCDDVRQEFILLSDVLGVSMLVETINHRGRRDATESDRARARSTWSSRRPASWATNIDLEGKGEPCLVERPGHRRRTATPLAGARRSTSGRPTRTASTTSSNPACSRSATCAGCSPPTRTGAFWFRSIVPRALPDPRLTVRSASCSRTPDVTRTARRTSTSSSRAPGLRHPVTTHVFVADTAVPRLATRSSAVKEQPGPGVPGRSTTRPEPRVRRPEPVPHAQFDVVLPPRARARCCLRYEALPMRVVLRRRRAGRRRGRGGRPARPAPGAGACADRSSEDTGAGWSPTSSATVRPAVLAEARMHVPVEVADRAVETGHGEPAPMAAWRWAAGRRSASARRSRSSTGLPVIAVPTTYAGSEMTPGLGTDRGRREAHRARPARSCPSQRRVRPRADPRHARCDLSATSGLNAVAHAVEAPVRAGRLARHLP